MSVELFCSTVYTDDGFNGSLMFQQLTEFFCICVKKITFEFVSKWCGPDWERAPRCPRNLKSLPCVLRLDKVSFRRTSVETVNSLWDDNGWKKAVRYPFFFGPESATEKIPSFHWNCKPTKKIVKILFYFWLQYFFTINVKISLKRVKEEEVMIKPPSSVLRHTKHDQSIVEPIRNINKAMCTVVIVDGDARQALTIRNDVCRNFKATNYKVGVEVDSPHRWTLHNYLPI